MRGEGPPGKRSGSNVQSTNIMGAHISCISSEDEGPDMSDPYEVQGMIESLQAHAINLGHFQNECYKATDKIGDEMWDFEDS